MIHLANWQVFCSLYGQIPEYKGSTNMNSMIFESFEQPRSCDRPTASIRESRTIIIMQWLVIVSTISVFVLFPERPAWGDGFNPRTSQERMDSYLARIGHGALDFEQAAARIQLKWFRLEEKAIPRAHSLVKGGGPCGPPPPIDQQVAHLEQFMLGSCSERGTYRPA